MSIIVFFFSSRRRHTRSKRDWSSDVCSSDLDASAQKPQLLTQLVIPHAVRPELRRSGARARSEERRVGKEWRYRGGAYRFNKKHRVIAIDCTVDIFTI